ncbi:homogentisate 1,2-dioxygenase [Telmatocola sphagniphila]|uniref:Homogentisate 1,2-dioxygenase n=1 Tax=Telmatocola sphagniphila TaxID=1123043 RepID=A0A8E6BAQ6_9BACT|nr:homogentisate 1,2-dioxygenase [Telmatocola sphagniphila]QVL33693.1 homogentisate 1,2-dioxygenase [Telmatocola sphagniphila]
MPYYRQFGSIPPKHHIEHPQIPGYRNEGIFYEEVITTEGFNRAYSILYHLRPPTRVKHQEHLKSIAIELVSDPMLRHIHLKTKEIARAGDVIFGRTPMFHNSDVTISRCRPAKQQEQLYKNASADEVLFIHSGSGVLHSLYGKQAFHPFDYVVIPRGTIYKIVFDDIQKADLLIVDSPPPIRLPHRYKNADGQIRLGAPYSERDFHGPSQLDIVDQEADTELILKKGENYFRYVLASHPFDVVGWDGLIYPYTFNADDFEPITGTIHQPPPIHQTFETSGFVICTFAPRVLDTHPKAVKVPYAHSNVDSDEVLYYVRGKFGSRRGVEESSFTLHPLGIPHGPHPGTIVASRAHTRTDELAVMIDTFRPLHLTQVAIEYDDPKYPLSWLE